MELKEGMTVKLKNNTVAKIVSFGVALNPNFGNINLDNGTFCFKDDIIKIIK